MDIGGSAEFGGASDCGVLGVIRLPPPPSFPPSCYQKNWGCFLKESSIKIVKRERERERQRQRQRQTDRETERQRDREIER